ncbi:MAG: ribosomal protein S18-alanine N-acetyltransferase [Caldisericaceae bacterium]
MDEDFKIVKATSKDIDRIIEIEEKSYEDPWPREVFMIDYLFNNCSLYFVLKIKSKVAGFIGIWEEESSLHVINLAIDPDYRRKGYGRLMLQFAVDLALNKKVGKVYLEARKSNVIAQKLYTSCGFVPVEELRSYYQDGEDGVRMMKTLLKGEQ